MYQSQHRRVNSRFSANHKQESDLEIQLRRKAAVGLTLAGAGLAAVSAVGVPVNATTTSTSSSANKTKVVQAGQKDQANQQPAAKTQADIEKEALTVIHGDLGNGAERVQNLQQAGFDPTAVQNQVNQDYIALGLGGAAQAAAVAQTPTAYTPTASGTTSNNTPYTGSDLVNYAAQQMAASTGVSAGQWAAVIMRESGGNPNIANSSSGAYGLFQLLGHGEYSGMSVDEQIAMAKQVYQSQGPGAWAETW